MKCFFCDALGPFPLHHAATAYHHPVECGHEDCAQNAEMKALCFEARDPNPDRVMCDGCAVEYYEFWREQWDEYYAMQR